MAGKGSRFLQSGISTPKPLILVDGITLAEHSIKTLGIDGKFIFITRTFDDPEHNKQLTEIFEKCCNDFIEIRVDDDHYGAAHSSLFAEHYINSEEPLVVTNCDQHMDWDAQDFMSSIPDDADGSVVLYKSDNPKNSFALMDGEVVVKIVEKEPISEDALVGIHYWKRGQDFFDSARKLLGSYSSMGYNECYVAVTYEFLIADGKKIYGHTLKDSTFFSLGTPQDLEDYNEHRYW